MKLTILVDNNSIIDRYFLAEPGLSLYIEVDNKKILFDLGYSNAFLVNSHKAHINLLDLDYIIISHGHMDHTWGLPHFINLITETTIEKHLYRKPMLVAHPFCFFMKWLPDIGSIGSMLTEGILKKYFNLNLSRNPVWLSANVVFLGEIPRKNSFESKYPIGKTIIKGQEEDDFLADDSAIAIRLAEGLVIITGCSHAGICNIVEYAREVCKEDRIYDIIGGFHLLDPPKEQLINTVEFFKKINPYLVHACHCTDLNSKIALSKVCNLKEVGSGISIDYNKLI